MLRAVVPMLVVAALAGGGCGGSLTQPDAGGAGQLGGTGGGSGGTGGAGGVGNISGAGGDIAIIVDARPADEPCALEVRVMAIADESCRFDLPVPPCSYASNSNIGVRINGVEWPHDPNQMNGWDYTDATQRELILYGPACDAAIATSGVVTIYYKIILP